MDMSRSRFVIYQTGVCVLHFLTVGAAHDLGAQGAGGRVLSGAPRDAESTAFGR